MSKTRLQIYYSSMSQEFSSVQAAVDAIRRGEVVIVLDAKDRENEGDYICAAELVTPEIINFMLRGRGQLCCPILPSTSERLDLRPIVENNNAPLRTAFLTPVDHVDSKTGLLLRNGRRRFGGWPATRPQKPTLCDLGTFIHCWRWKVECCAAPDIQKQPSTCLAWRDLSLQGS
jgi:hypothetical protein